MQKFYDTLDHNIIKARFVMLMAKVKARNNISHADYNCAKQWFFNYIDCFDYYNDVFSYNNKKDKQNKKSKTEIVNELNKKNKNKAKNAPKEYSALIKPKFQFKDQAHQQKSSLLNKKFHRDPRFDDLSGELNETAFKKNFAFVNDMAKEYVENLKKVKNNKKLKKKLPQETFELLKKQNNYVKGWLNQQKQNEEKQEIKTEINKENKKRMSQGQKPIFVNKNKVNKFLKKKKETKED